MSLKQKIWASYIVMIIVPFFLAVLSARLILINYEQGHQLQIIEAVQDKEIREYTDFAEELESTLVNHPDYFKDKLYLERINNKITSFGMGMLIQDNDQFT